MKWAFINWVNRSRLYSSEPRASLIGEISVCMISIASSMICSDNILPVRKCDAFERYIGIGPTPPAAMDADTMVCSLVVMRMAELTLAISRCVRLLTFSKWKSVSASGNSNQMLWMNSSVFLSSCL